MLFSKDLRLVIQPLNVYQTKKVLLSFFKPLFASVKIF
jgi:hypothetical protein